MLTSGESLKKRVLVVDDDPAVGQVLNLALAEAGWRVALANTGAEGWDKVVSLKPDLIILDLILPDMDGLEICRRIKTSRELKKTPVFILSAKTRPEDRAAGRQAGANQYLTKPFSPEMVVRVVRRYLHREGKVRRNGDSREGFSSVGARGRGFNGDY